MASFLHPKKGSDKMIKLCNKFYFWFLIIGISFLAVGIKIIATGELRNIVVLGQTKYFLGGFSIACGLYFLANSKKKN